MDWILKNILWLTEVCYQENIKTYKYICIDSKYFHYKIIFKKSQIIYFSCDNTTDKEPTVMNHNILHFLNEMRINK